MSFRNTSIDKRSHNEPPNLKAHYVGFFSLSMFYNLLYKILDFLFGKSILGFQNWTKINVQKSKPKILLPKRHSLRP